MSGKCEHTFYSHRIEGKFERVCMLCGKPDPAFVLMRKAEKARHDTMQYLQLLGQAHDEAFMEGEPDEDTNVKCEKAYARVQRSMSGLSKAIEQYRTAVLS